MLKPIDTRRIPEYRPDLEGEMSDPENFHDHDLYDEIWDGETNEDDV